MKSTLSFSIICSLSLLLTSCSSQPLNRNLSIPLRTETYVDLDRYLGRWYEIARLPNRFERNCEGVTANYARRDDGLIAVTNTCRKDRVDGTSKIANGRARIVDTKSNAKLEVSFFGPFWGDYWILDIDEDYQISLVGEPSGKYLWILSRTPTLNKTTSNEIMLKLQRLGYQTDALYFPAQPPA